MGSGEWEWGARMSRGETGHLGRERGTRKEGRRRGNISDLRASPVEICQGFLYEMLV